MSDYETLPGDEMGLEGLLSNGDLTCLGCMNL